MSSLVTFLQRTPPLIQDIEYRKAVRHNAFYAKDLIALLVAEGRPHCLVSCRCSRCAGEEPDRTAAVSFVSKLLLVCALDGVTCSHLLQAGCIHSFDQSSDLRSNDSVYAFEV